MTAHTCMINRMYIMYIYVLPVHYVLFKIKRRKYCDGKTKYRYQVHRSINVLGRPDQRLS